MSTPQPPIGDPTLVQVAPFPVPDVYDDRYAENYDETWWDSEIWAKDGVYHLELLASWLEPETRWLDVGCGTGWMLRHFPQIESRAGVDLSEHVLAKARATCPGAELRLADVLEPHEPWVDQWDLVTCTGQPWSYLRTLEQFDAWVAQLAAWTSPEGRCFNQVPDILELTGHAIPYHLPPDEPPVGVATVLAVHWAMDEPFTEHGPMIWPSVDVWVRLFAKYFTRVEVLHADPALGLRFPRAIVASGKRQPGDTGLELVYEPPTDAREPVSAAAPVPEPAPATAEQENEARRRQEWEEENRRAWEANDRAWAENQERWEQNAITWEEHQQHVRRETARADAATARADAATARAEAAEAKLTAGSGVGTKRLSTTSTGELARTLLGRFRPRRLWRRFRER